MLNILKYILPSCKKKQLRLQLETTDPRGVTNRRPHGGASARQSQAGGMLLLEGARVLCWGSWAERRAQPQALSHVAKPILKWQRGVWWEWGRRLNLGWFWEEPENKILREGVEVGGSCPFISFSLLANFLAWSLPWQKLYPPWAAAHLPSLPCISWAAANSEWEGSTLCQRGARGRACRGEQEGGSVGKAFFCGFQGACSRAFLVSKLQPIHLHTDRREAVVAGRVAGSCSWQLSALIVPWGSPGRRYLNPDLGLFLCWQTLEGVKLLRKRAAGSHTLELDKNAISLEM